MSATGSRRDAGYTLIEALVVVAITTLVALIGFPMMRSALLGLSQRQTVAVVAADLRRVRADALRADARRTFAVSRDGRRYAATGTGVAGTPPGVELTSAGGAPISFYGDGSSSGGAVWVSAARRSIPIVVSSATGAISVGG